MLKILYVMDPMDRIQVDADSTFVMQMEAQSRGHQHHSLPRDLVVQKGSRRSLSRPGSRSEPGRPFQLSWRIEVCPLARV